MYAYRLRSDLINAHSCCEIVDAGENQINGPAGEGAGRDAPHHVLEVLERLNTEGGGGRYEDLSISICIYYMYPYINLYE